MNVLGSEQFKCQKEVYATCNGTVVCVRAWTDLKMLPTTELSTAVNMRH